jgi:D-sedoheptulose 7-phosphate isomerase
MERFVDEYLALSAETLLRIPADSVDRISRRLLQAYESCAQIFLAGNGGSAALASHLACDLAKTVSGAQPRNLDKRFRVISLSDNVATLTAWANDESFDCVFSEPLRNSAQPDDVLLVISASGDSPNIIKAIETGLRLQMTTIGLLGFSGGQAKTMLDEFILIDSDDYGIVEGAHGVLTHLLSSWLTCQVATLQHPASHTKIIAKQKAIQ